MNVKVCVFVFVSVLSGLSVFSTGSAFAGDLPSLNASKTGSNYRLLDRSLSVGVAQTDDKNVAPTINEEGICVDCRPANAKRYGDAGHVGTILFQTLSFAGTIFLGFFPAVGIDVLVQNSRDEFESPFSRLGFAFGTGGAALLTSFTVWGVGHLLKGRGSAWTLAVGTAAGLLTSFSAYALGSEPEVIYLTGQVASLLTSIPFYHLTYSEKKTSQTVRFNFNGNSVSFAGTF